MIFKIKENENWQKNEENGTKEVFSIARKFTDKLNSV